MMTQGNTMSKQCVLLALCFFVCAAALACASENLLREANFDKLQSPGSAWEAIVDKAGKAEPAKAADGKTSAVCVKAAAITQQVALPEGLFELTVRARGQGELLLRVSGAGERSQMLSKDWGTYGYLFQANAGVHTARIRVLQDGIVTNAAIRPTTDARRNAWQKAEEVFRQFGFYTSSVQRPTPGSATLEFTGNVKSLAAMTNRVVLDDSRLDAAHMSPESALRLTDWLGQNGFVRLNSEALSGAIAVEFVLRDPKGNQSVISGVRATKDGQGTFDWTPAVNDPVGIWTLEATELASGKTATAQITLNQ